MSDPDDLEVPSALPLELFQPHPDVLYSLDATAYLARVPRRSILVYCRAGLLRPVFQPPYGVMAFTEDAIYTTRRIEEMRAAHGIGVTWIKAMFDLLDEVERLRAEIRFFRNQ
ncbi:MAG: hypothetical protein P4L99_27260 [Chthoniobacter sp.]|nr:hypothetical protein [Chthoniobacter sp.]